IPLIMLINKARNKAE
nr:MHC class II H 2EK natural ligand {internal fragment, peak b} [mice, CH27 cells, Peptide Partial, 15 aa] [Mus sp.]